MVGLALAVMIGALAAAWRLSADEQGRGMDIQEGMTFRSCVQAYEASDRKARAQDAMRTIVTALPDQRRGTVWFGEVTPIGGGVFLDMQPPPQLDKRGSRLMDVRPGMVAVIMDGRLIPAAAWPEGPVGQEVICVFCLGGTLYRVQGDSWCALGGLRR